MDEDSRVALPDGVASPLEVYVNGVLQQRGRDFEVRGRELLFTRPLAQEGRLGFFRWLSIFLGFAGTYRRHDSVDVVYELDGRRLVASGLAAAQRSGRYSFAGLVESPGVGPPMTTWTRPFAYTTPRPWRGLGRSGRRRQRFVSRSSA